VYLHQYDDLDAKGRKKKGKRVNRPVRVVPHTDGTAGSRKRRLGGRDACGLLKGNEIGGPTGSHAVVVVGEEKSKCRILQTLYHGRKEDRGEPEDGLKGDFWLSMIGPCRGGKALHGNVTAGWGRKSKVDGSGSGDPRNLGGNSSFIKGGGESEAASCAGPLSMTLTRQEERERTSKKKT